MNLRQQFFWRVLIVLSTLSIIFLVYNTYSKYTEFSDYKDEYEKELEVKENKDMQSKADFITNKQSSRNMLDVDLLSIQEQFVTNHIRAGIKSNNKSAWASNDPIYKGMVGNNALIDYRESKGKRYKISEYILDTDMMIKSFSRDSVVIEYPNKDLRAFYLQSYEQLKK